MKIGEEYIGKYDDVTYKVVSNVTNIGGVTAVALLREDGRQEVYVKSLADIERNWIKVPVFVPGWYRRKDCLRDTASNHNSVRWFDEMEPNDDFEAVTVTVKSKTS